MKPDFTPLLLGKDLRSIGRVSEVVDMVHDQETFDSLFNLLFHHERLLVMRAADAIEKITLKRPDFLQPHKKQLLGLLHASLHKELKWHLAVMVTRVKLDPKEAKEVWDVLSYWARNPHESKIVRVNSLQGLYELTARDSALRDKFIHVLRDLGHEPVPSLQARIRKIRKQLPYG